MQGSLVGLCFRGFNFGYVVAAGALFSATGSPYISVLYFIGCRFGVNDGIDMPPAGVGFYNCVFKGIVNFDESIVPEKSVLEYLTFFREVSFKDTQFKPEVKIQNLSFAPFITQTAKDGFKSILSALNKSGYAKEAKFYEQNVGADGVDTKINKDEFDIAARSNWLNIKQTAAFLGISYATLLAMRKEDKADGIRRIPYIGEGKSSRYYLPLLEAYKSRDWKLVEKLARELEKNT